MRNAILLNLGLSHFLFITRYIAVLPEPHDEVRVIDYTLKSVTYTIAHICIGSMVHFVVYLVDRPDEILSYALF